MKAQNVSMLLIMCEREMAESVLDVLHQAGVTSYTEVPTVYGSGQHGPKRESRTAPGAISLLLVAIDEKQSAEIVQEINELKDTYEETIDFALRVFQLRGEQVI